MGALVFDPPSSSRQPRCSCRKAWRAPSNSDIARQHSYYELAKSVSTIQIRVARSPAEAGPWAVRSTGELLAHEHTPVGGVEDVGVRRIDNDRWDRSQPRCPCRVSSPALGHP